MNNILTPLHIAYVLGHQYITNDYIGIIVSSTVLSLTMIAIIKHYRDEA